MTAVVAEDKEEEEEDDDDDEEKDTEDEEAIVRFVFGNILNGLEEDVGRMAR